MQPPEFDSIHTRGRALEEAFCHKQDEALLQKLRAKMSAEESQRVLSAAIGIADELSIQAISKVQAGVQVLAAMAILPLVEVAWCDGEVEAAERRAILAAAAQMEIKVDSPVYQFLERCLEHRPTPDAVAAWKKYVQAICATLEPATVRNLKSGVIGRAEKIALAAGGILGFGSRVSATEQACLDDLAKAFDA